MAVESKKSQRFLMHLEPLRGSLEAYCRRNLNDSNAVEDVLQTVVAKAYRDFHRYVEDTNFRAWIFRYLNWEIFNRNRSDRRAIKQPLLREVPVDDLLLEGQGSGSDPQELLEFPEIVLEHCDDVLAQAIHALSPLERSAFLLQAIGEFKYREIAQILEIPIGSVMGYLARSRAQLRRQLLRYAQDRGWEPMDGQQPHLQSAWPLRSRK